MKRYAKAFTGLLAIVAVGMGLPAQAVTCTWKGATGDWFDGNNWTNGVPGNGDDAIVNSGLVLLTNSTPALGSLTQGGGDLVFSNWTTALTATNVYLYGGTHSTPAAFTAGQMSNRVWIACTNLFLAAGARIDVAGKG